MSGFNLSAFAVRERAITLFLIVAVILAGAGIDGRCAVAWATPGTRAATAFSCSNAPRS